MTPCPRSPWPYRRRCYFADLPLSVDHRSVPFGKAEDCLTLVRAVKLQSLRPMLGLYHAQIGEGNLINLCRKALSSIGEIQVADVPGGCEPGTGEIDYPAIATALAEMGYRGTVGLGGPGPLVTTNSR
jgi:hydroxypyruvate isomerase